MPLRWSGWASILCLAAAVSPSAAATLDERSR